MLSLLAWAFVAFGVTDILSRSSIFKPLRTRLETWGETSKVAHWLHKLIICPRCTGFWVGVLLSLLGLSLVRLTGFVPADGATITTAVLPITWPRWLVCWADGAATSALCWVVYVAVASCEKYAGID